MADFVPVAETLGAFAVNDPTVSDGTDSAYGSLIQAAALPSGSDADITFISGVTSSARVAGTSFWTWNGDAPATYSATQSYSTKWGSTTLSTSGTPGGNVTYWFDAVSNWTATEKNAFASALALWSAVADITFSLAASAASAKFTFFRGSDGSAYQYFPNQTPSTVGSDTEGGPGTGAMISIDTRVAGFGPIGGSFSTYGGYPYQTMIHEIGHMLGLGHGGPYNGSVNPSTQQFSVYDSRLWTLMSYIDPIDTSAKYYSSYPVTGTNWGISPDGYYYVPTTPMIMDILAVQRIYGAPTSGPLASGGLIFGFNCNVSGLAKQYFDFAINSHPVITIWASGTNNTLDLSGFTANATISLAPGTFTSCNGEVNNIGIAIGAVIENAIGGAGNDSFIGAAGNHTFGGGSGTDTVNYAAAPAGVSVNLSTGSGTNGYGGSDNYAGIENVTGSAFSDVITAASGTHALNGGAGFDQVVLPLPHSSFTTNTFNAQTGNGTLAGSGQSDSLAGIEAIAFINLQHGGPFNPAGAQYADVTGDGKFDLIYQGVDNQFWLAVATGNDLSPNSTSAMAHGGPSFQAGQAQYADITGDGKADLMYQGVGNRFWLSASNGNGFDPSSYVMGHGGSFIAGEAQYADITGDGKADLIYQGMDNRFWLSASNGNGFNSTSYVMAHGGPSFQAGQAQYADINGDGKADLIYQGVDNRFWLSLSNDNGFETATQAMSHGGPFVAGETQYADVTGDGKADMIYQGLDNRFWLATGNDNGFTLDTTAVASFGGTFVAGSAQYADLNNDGRDDLIFQDFSNGVWAATSNGSEFNAAQQIGHFEGNFLAGILHVVDVNGDDRADLMFETTQNQFLMSLNNLDFLIV